MNKTPSFPFLVADIGGTNARFGIVSGAKDDNGRFLIKYQKTYQCAEFNSFESVLSAYLKTLSSKPKYACIAVAGPVIGESIKMTNLNWSFTIEALCHDFEMTSIKVINDFGALAYSTLYLQKNEIDVLYSGNEEATDYHSASRALVGPGTGLGVASLIKTPQHWQPICGEGGHVSFAPLNDFEVELRNTILKAANKNHVCIEDVVSGPGLVNIYRTHCHINNAKEQTLTPNNISSKARTESDEQCIATMKTFSQLLGSVAGDIALTMGAFGGVYLGGGILPKIIGMIDKDLLIERYLRKGVQQDLLERIPIYLISSDVPALTGAAHWMYDTYLE